MNGPAVTPKTIEGLRDMLFKEMDDFRAGKSSIKRAQVIVNFSKEILNATRMELVNAAIQLDVKNGRPTLRLK